MPRDPIKHQIIVRLLLSSSKLTQLQSLSGLVHVIGRHHGVVLIVVDDGPDGVFGGELGSERAARVF